MIATQRRRIGKVASILSFANVTENDESSLRDALVKQPVSVCIDAQCDAFMNYGGGVLDEDCGTHIDHCVLAVGYELTGKEYYIVKNSWGTSWGKMAMSG